MPQLPSLPIESSCIAGVGGGVVGDGVKGLRLGASVGLEVSGDLLGDTVGSDVVGLDVTGLRLGASVGLEVGSPVVGGLVGCMLGIQKRYEK